MRSTVTISKKRRVSRWALLFTLKEFPAIAAIAIACCAWTLVRIVDSLTEAPTIEYHLEATQKELGRVEHRAIIRNLSKKQAFRDFTIVLQIPSGSDVRLTGTPTSVPYAPARAVYTSKPDIRNPTLAVFPFAQLHPEWAFELYVTQEGGSIKTPFSISVLSPDPAGPQGAKSEYQAIRLVPSSVGTYFVRYETQILLALLAFLVVCAGISLCKISDTPEQE